MKRSFTGEPLYMYNDVGELDARERARLRHAAIELRWEIEELDGSSSGGLDAQNHNSALRQ